MPEGFQFYSACACANSAALFRCFGRKITAASLTRHPLYLLHPPLDPCDTLPLTDNRGGRNYIGLQYSVSKQ